VLARLERFNKQPVDGGWGWIRQIEAGQVHLAVPSREQFEVPRQSGLELRVNGEAGATNPSAQAILKLSTQFAA
jgi:hypothetical protein